MMFVFPPVSVIGLLHLGVTLIIAFAVLLQRKEPASTVAWLLTVSFFPFFGAFLFFLFGRERVRIPAKRKRATDEALQTQLTSPPTTLPAKNGSGTAPALSTFEQELFHVSQRLTHQAALPGNSIDLYFNGHDKYQALEAAIRAARDHVHAAYYLIRNDDTGTWFCDLLSEAARRGVTVRLLCDGFGCLAMGRRHVRQLVAAGVKVANFLPMRSLLLQPVNLRNHRKIVVVDGETAFAGGINIGDEYAGRIQRIGRWRDTHLRLRGGATALLQRVFLKDWYFVTGELVAGERYVPTTAAMDGETVVAVIPSGPDTRSQAIHQVFFSAIAAARQRVWITTPYFVPDRAMLCALQAASLRGVDVEILLPAHSNHGVTFHAGRSFYEELLEAGVRLYEYQPGMIHAKTMLVDRHTALVGSANMDVRSFRLNFEVHLLMHGETTARGLETSFEEDRQACREVELPTWRGRPLRWRVAEGVGRFLSPLL